MKHDEDVRLRVRGDLSPLHLFFFLKRKGFAAVRSPITHHRSEVVRVITLPVCIGVLLNKRSCISVFSFGPAFLFLKEKVGGCSRHHPAGYYSGIPSILIEDVEAAVG